VARDSWLAIGDESLATSHEQRATMRRLSILGSTGSIGQQVLDVAERLGDRVRVVGLAAHRNVELLAEQVRRFRPGIAAVGDPSQAERLRALLEGVACKTAAGRDGLNEVAAWPEADILVVSLAGSPGLEPTLAGIEAGKRIALASKEVLVMAGEIVTEAAEERGVPILPIDSEHSAIFQCLQGERREDIERIILTASGGPFRATPLDDQARMTPEQALAHPTWQMGKKITVDSANLMNKALEIIEAHWLFGVPASGVQVVIHPQSIVHSMVMLADGSVIAQLGLPDMRLPIQYALMYPERFDTNLPKLDIMEKARLTFEAPDYERFPALGLAYQAAEAGGTMPAVLSAADEVAADLFLSGNLSFPGIVELVGRAMSAHEPAAHPDLHEILKADRWARETARRLAKGE